MAFIVGPGDEPPEGEEEDPTRTANRKFISALAFRLETDLQMSEAFEAISEELKARVANLESRTAMLEGLIVGRDPVTEANLRMQDEIREARWAALRREISTAEADARVGQAQARRDAAVRELDR